VAWPLTTLDGTIGRHPNLDRPPRRPPGEVGEQGPYGVAERGGVGSPAGVEGIEGGRNRRGLTARSGHVGTIRR
jgi:hypothetical protein